MALSPAPASAAKRTDRARPCPSTITAQPDEASVGALVKATVCLVNQERAKRGLKPLRNNRRLAKAAVLHSRDMVKRQYFDHLSPEGDDIVRRLFRTRYLNKRIDWTAGENIAWGSLEQGTPRRIVNAWMKSPAHRRNILNRHFREIGMGIVLGAPVADEGIPVLPELPPLPFDPDVEVIIEEDVVTELPAATYTSTFGARNLKRPRGKQPRGKQPRGKSSSRIR